MDKTFNDPDGNTIHVLQRPLADLQDAIANELAPFLEVPARYRILPSDIKKPTHSFWGNLTELTWISADFGFKVRVQPLKMEEPPLSLLTGKVSECLLTVWRVNNILDLLQVNLLSYRYNVYMHAGGDNLSELALQDGSPQNAELREAISLLAKIENYPG